MTSRLCHPTDPITATPTTSDGGIAVVLSGHPDTLAAFVDAFGADLDHDFPLVGAGKYSPPRRCIAWPSSARADLEELLDALRRTSDVARIDLVIQPVPRAHDTIPAPPPAFEAVS